MMRAYSIARHERRPHKRTLSIMAAKLAQEESDQLRSADIKHSIKPVVSCIVFEGVDNAQTRQILEMEEADKVKGFKAGIEIEPNQVLKVEPVTITEEPITIGQKQQQTIEKAERQVENHVDDHYEDQVKDSVDGLVKDSAEDAVEHEVEATLQVTFGINGDAQPCVEPQRYIDGTPVMPDSAIERTDTPPFQSDIQHQDLAIWDAEDQPCEHVVIEAVRYSCEDGQQPLPPTTENNNGNEDPSTQDSQQAAINDPWACINDHRSNICDQACILHSSNDKITNNHTQVETSSNEEGQVADLSVPITEECVAFAVVDKREFEHNTLSKDNTAAEPDSQTFKRDSRRKMSIRRLSDAFTRSKYPSSVETAPAEPCPQQQEKKRMSIFDTPKATKRLLRKKSSLFLSKIKSSFHTNKKNEQTVF